MESCCTSSAARHGHIEVAVRRPRDALRRVEGARGNGGDGLRSDSQRCRGEQRNEYDRCDPPARGTLPFRRGHSTNFGGAAATRREKTHILKDTVLDIIFTISI